MSLFPNYMTFHKKHFRQIRDGGEEWRDLKKEGLDEVMKRFNIHGINYLPTTISKT